MVSWGRVILGIVALIGVAVWAVQASDSELLLTAGAVIVALVWGFDAGQKHERERQEGKRG